MASGQGWPFLVARGRHRGYSVLLAPDFLVADGDYGFLEEQAAPSGSVQVASGHRMHGRPVCLVWTEQVAGGADVGTEQAPRDEHSRPLRLIVGFVSAEAIAAPATADLDAARTTALRCYRQFLADEDRFTVQSSAPFALRSVIRPAPTTPAPSTPSAPTPPRRFVGPAVVAAVAVAVVAVIIALVRPSAPAQEPPPPCPTTQTPTPTPAKARPQAPSPTTTCRPEDG
jgi:hypothetical protein